MRVWGRVTRIADDGTDEGEDDPGAFVAAEDAPIFEEAAGFGVFVGRLRVAVTITVAVTVGWAAREGTGRLIGGIGGDEAGIVWRRLGVGG